MLHGACQDYRKAIEQRGSLAAVGLVFKPHLLSLWADEIAHRPAVLDVVEAVLGPDLLIWSVDVFIRPALGGADEGDRRGVAPQGLAWHQDSPYLGLRPLDRIVRTWHALTPTTVENGTMRYLRGSHRGGEYEHRYEGAAPQEMERGPRAAVTVEEARVVPVLLSPGEYSIHDIRIVHDSGENGTHADRICVAVTYVAPDVRPASPDSATLARGRDRCGHFRLEPRPGADFAREALEAFLEAMTLKIARFGGLPDAI